MTNIEPQSDSIAIITPFTISAPDFSCCFPIAFSFLTYLITLRVLLDWTDEAVALGITPTLTPRRALFQIEQFVLFSVHPVSWCPAAITPVTHFGSYLNVGRAIEMPADITLQLMPRVDDVFNHGVGVLTVPHIIANHEERGSTIGPFLFCRYCGHTVLSHSRLDKRRLYM